MARRYENSPEDEAEDAAGAKALGVSRKAYEKTPRDKAEDAAGENRISVKPHHRKPPSFKPKAAPASPMPGPFDFSADQEKAMRGGQRAANNPQPAPPSDDDDMGME
jgi:hypothetical protein